MDIGSQEHRQDGDLVHVAVTSLKGRAFRTEKKPPDELREPSDERQTGKARGDAFTGTGIECVFEDVEVLKVLKHYSIWQKTYREVLKMYDQSSRVFSYTENGKHLPV